jgi:hypothetical protein
MITPILWLLACGGGNKAADLGDVPADDTLSSETGPSYTIDDAELAFTEPGPAGFTGHGSAVSVGGVAKAMSAVTVNGVAAELDGASFSAPLDLLPGIHLVQVESTDLDGGAHSQRGSILAGDYGEPSGPSYDAVQMHLSASSIRSLGPLLEGFLTPDMLNPTIQGLNPVVDSPDAVVNLGDLRFDQAVVSLEPTDMGLLLSMELPNFVLPIDATIPDVFLGIDLDVGADVEADVWIDALVDVDTDGRGNLVVTVTHVEAELGDFDLDTGLLELIDWLFVDDDDLAVFIENQLESFGPAIGSAINGMIGGLDLATEMELMGTMVSIEPAFDHASVTSQGMALGLAVQVEADGEAPQAPGYLAFSPPPAAQGPQLHGQISDDFINRALFEVWAAGMLNLEMPLGEGPEGALLLIFGGGDEGALSLDAKLPPVWVERNGQARIQMGEVYLTVDTPGGSYGEQVELLMNLDAAAEIAFDGTAAGITLSDAQVDLVAVGSSANNDDLDVEAISAAFGIGVSIINGLLSFPLDGLVPPGALPPIDFARDPSGLGTSLDLDLGAVDVGALLGIVPPPPNLLPVPGSATVYDLDGDIADDLVEGWVCGGRTVTATGTGGTWYVAGDLVVSGTGHVVYAVDDAQVVLDGPGNTVFFDPSADVDDNDGTNTVTEIDPLELELSGAPVPGCP